MELIADILMIAGTFVMAIYCIVLSRRLSRFTDLEKGVGGAIAVLSAQVDDMSKMLNQAQKTATISAQKLEDLTNRAEGASRRLEILIASTHDLPEPSDISPNTQKEQETPPKAADNEFVQKETEGAASETAVFASKRLQAEAAQ